MGTGVLRMLPGVPIAFAWAIVCNPEATWAQPTNETPAEETPAADAPRETAPAVESPTDSAPAEETASVEAPAEDTLAEGEVRESEGEVIVITGSVIERLETTTAAPVAVLDKVEIEASGMVSIGEILQNLPSQSNAINVQFNNGGEGSTRVSLRGLGSSRTLVLLNGRRHVPGGVGANSSVDLSAIPIAIIERVEVLKDGASAIYGSDAIGGVVNIITRKGFNGTEATLYTGTTGHGDGTVYDMSMVTGVSSKKGSILFSASYYEQQDIMAGDREFSKTDKWYLWEQNDGSWDPNGSVGTPEGTLWDWGEGPGNSAWEAVLERCPSGFCFNDPEEGWRDFDWSGNSDDGTGDLYNYQPVNYLLTPSKRYGVHSEGEWKLADRIDAFYETGYNKRISSQLLAATPLYTLDFGGVYSAESIYNPYGRDFIDIGRRMLEQGGRRYSQDIDTFRLVTGFEGTIQEAGNWKWNVAYNFGRTAGTDINQGRFIASRVRNAMGPSFYDDNGVARCGTVDAPIDDCVPLNLFGGEDTITREMLDYISYTGIARGYTMQNSIGGNVHGKLFDTPWGGDVRLGVGAEFRRLRGESLPDPVTASGDTTGNREESTGGYFDVTEGYAEISAVPVMNKPLAKWLELTAAVRGFHYNTFGSDFTYKTGALWRMPEGVALRGTYSTAFRAPSISDLFLGQTDSFEFVTDPCDTLQGPRTPTVDANCTADGIPSDFEDPSVQLRTLWGGSPDLEPETAEIVTSGVVYEPPSIDGLALTLDYFWINIENAIQRTGAAIILSNCYRQGTGTDRSNCENIERDPTTNLIVNINDRNTNIGGNKTAGVDFQIRYDWAHLTAGKFRHNLEGTWLYKYNETQSDGRIIEGVGVYDLGVHPRFKANFATLWAKEALGAGFNVRYIGGFEECIDDDCDTYLQMTEAALESAGYMNGASREVDSNVTADVFANYNFDTAAGKSILSLGVNNVMDQDPAVIFNGSLGTSDASTYDFMGRYFYMRLTQTY